MPPKRRTAGKKRGRAAEATNTTTSSDVVPESTKTTKGIRREEEEEQDDDWLHRTPISTPQRTSKDRPSITTSPRLSNIPAAAQELSHTPRFASKRSRSNDHTDNQSRSSRSTSESHPDNNTHTEEEREEDEEMQAWNMRRTTTGDSRRSMSSVGVKERHSNSAVLHGEEGFFHDLKSMHPLRVRLGVCPLPGNNNTNNDNNNNNFGMLPTSIQTTGDITSTTALLLGPRKFFTLPEEKGGADVVGWAAAFPSVSLELPSEGVYNKASVSVTLMLPP
ncbi:hypothetical protein LSM04_005145 [Trypanosoma melophagium]|uniref:uncharacterized protein n=1 Tax=Trypanosoma melophagium TaxID=715481 RepID=UPI00351A1472|nr:hypothetical protein LSM04_005145 [Trypanosoma melophagium]